MEVGAETTSALPCSQCDRLFSSQRSLRCHVKIHNERTLKCCFCNLMYNRTDTLFLHALDHVTNGKIECHVENCSTVVDTMLEGEKHAFVCHSESGTAALKCKECLEVSPNFRKMVYHYTFKHGQLKEFANEMIIKQKEFLRQKKNETRKGKRSLADMMESARKEEEKEEEEEEGVDEAESVGFMDQLQTVISEGGDSDEVLGKLSDMIAELFPLPGTDQYQCLHCMMGFADAILWMTHLGFHDVDDPFKCTGCGRKFENRQTFVIHLTYFAHGAKEENKETQTETETEKM